MMLFVNSLAHLLVDGVCAATIFGLSSALEDLTVAVIVYNTLAFSTQGIVGLFTDRLKIHGYITAAACLIVVVGFFAPLPAIVKTAAVGVGNSLFHVGGGTITLLSSKGKAWKLGIFVAPGSIGLLLGKILPGVGVFFAAALTIFAFLIPFYESREKLGKADDSEEKAKVSIWIPVVLLIAIASRAIGGTSVSFPWKDTVTLTVLMALFVFAGKALGGFLCDAVGAVKAAIISLPIAAVLIAFCYNFMIPSLAGQFLVNLTMPVTLFLIYRALPDSPGFAFGLAASALWPGSIAGHLIALTGQALGFMILICLFIGLAAVMYASYKLKNVKGEDKQ